MSSSAYIFVAYILTLSRFDLHCTKMSYKTQNILCLGRLRRASGLYLKTRKTCHLNAKVLNSYSLFSLIYRALQIRVA